jgi:hypothetical protein
MHKHCAVCVVSVHAVGGRRLHAVSAIHVFMKRCRLVIQFASFSAVISGWEQPKIIRRHVGRLLSLLFEGTLCFSQKV